MAAMYEDASRAAFPTPEAAELTAGEMPAEDEKSLCDKAFEKAFGKASGKASGKAPGKASEDKLSGEAADRRGPDGRFIKRERDPDEGREEQDAARCRQVEDALYRRARGYKVALKKTFKVKRAEYDGSTGKKVCEREELETGVEEVHIPADVRVCAYYLNNRDPVRWREHPREENAEMLGGMVEYPDMAEVTALPEEAAWPAVAEGAAEAARSVGDERG